MPKLKPAQQSGSLIVELDSAGTANQQIDGGIAMGYRAYDCQYFNPKCLMKQCFSCSRYGHISLSCSDEKVCGACSSKTHCSSQCRRESVLLCPLCWDKKCEYRKKEIERIQLARSETPRYHTAINITKFSSSYQQAYHLESQVSKQFLNTIRNGCFPR